MDDPADESNDLKGLWDLNSLSILAVKDYGKKLFEMKFKLKKKWSERIGIGARKAFEQALGTTL